MTRTTYIFIYHSDIFLLYFHLNDPLFYRALNEKNKNFSGALPPDLHWGAYSAPRTFSCYFTCLWHVCFFCFPKNRCAHFFLYYLLILVNFFVDTLHRLIDTSSARFTESFAGYGCWNVAKIKIHMIWKYVFIKSK